MRKNIPVKDFFIGEKHPLTIISGPCVIESKEHTLHCAKTLKKYIEKTPFSFVFKASFDKANRTSIHSYRGPGIDRGLDILSTVKETLNIPILTDVHTVEEVKKAAKVCDILQIPAFLARQTDLILACAETNLVINVKKGQFMAPWDMKNVVEKIESTGNKKIILTDRGTSFGYNQLISDFRAIPIMKQFGYPVCYDATHSVQLPGGLKDSSGGDSQFTPVLAKAALAVGCNALYIETHPNPPAAKSDSAIVLNLSYMEKLLRDLEKIHFALYDNKATV